MKKRKQVEKEKEREKRNMERRIPVEDQFRAGRLEKLGTGGMGRPMIADFIRRV
jgi:hypothetical protein